MRAPSAPIQPFHIATVSAIPVRFYPAPSPSDAPWVAVDDLRRALGLAIDAIAVSGRVDEKASALTPEGDVVVISNRLAHEIISRAVVRASVDVRRAELCTDAMGAAIVSWLRSLDRDARSFGAAQPPRIAGADEDLDDPVHTATVAGRTVRFFKAPGDEVPWTSHGDVGALAKLSLADQDALVRHAQELPEYRREVASIRTAAGDEIVESHIATSALIGDLIRRGLLPPTVAPDYTAALEAALAAVHAGPPPAGLVERIRTVALVMYSFDEARPT